MKLLLLSSRIKYEKMGIRKLNQILIIKNANNKTLKITIR